jgi:hypothetical protein
MAGNLDRPIAKHDQAQQEESLLSRRERGETAPLGGDINVNGQTTPCGACRQCDATSPPVVPEAKPKAGLWDLVAQVDLLCPPQGASSAAERG